jgi:hypothetical protein
LGDDVDESIALGICPAEEFASHVFTLLPPEPKRYVISVLAPVNPFHVRVLDLRFVPDRSYGT